MSYIREAFEQVCRDAKTPASFYVCLMERIPFYGGEGWGTDHVLVSYQECVSEESAKVLAEAVDALAEQLNDEYGEYCSKSLDWMEERGLEPSSSYYVCVCESLPTNECTI